MHKTVGELSVFFRTYRIKLMDFNLRLRDYNEVDNICTENACLIAFFGEVGLMSETRNCVGIKIPETPKDK